MGKQEFDLVMDKVDDIAVAVNKFPESAQGAACTALVSALLHESTEFPNGSAQANGHQSQGIALPSETTVAQPIESTTQIAGPSSVNPTDNADEWDYRSVMLRLAREHDINLKKLTGQKFATFIASVFKIYGPKELQDEGITAEILSDACRTADRRLPGNGSATLSNAKENRLLDKAKGTGKYKLTPKGENIIYDLLNGDDNA